jgi:hypothetical protein
MWIARSERLLDSHGFRFALERNDGPATFAEVVEAWQKDAAFRSQFNNLLANVPYTAFRWETPSVASGMEMKPFEFVVLDSPGLVRRPDRIAFAEYFPRAEAGVTVFPNLGGDAIMVVPCPIGNDTAYGHLAAFVRQAPEEQRHALWQAVGKAMVNRIGPQPVWLSTAGAGVSWLHVRLDDRPKYYGFDPYRQMV